MAAMAEYAQSLFNLQHHIAKIVIQLRLCMAAYDERYIPISREFAQLKCENDLLRGGIVPSLDQDWELKVAYHRLSKAKHV
jgi:hypothetical protein